LVKDSLIEKQAGLLRSILSNIAENDLNKNEDFILFVNRYFNFDNDFGWNILMNAFYVFEDTELAKNDFNEFGLQGPSRHSNIGEKYLRLYGILNGLYQQSLAIKNLIELFKLENKSLIIQRIKESKCIELRNKIAAHPSNYSTGIHERKFDVYEISRPDLNNDKITLLKNQEDFEKYDLSELIINFNSLIQELFSLILAKFIKKKFNDQGKYFIEFQKLEKLRNGAIEFAGKIIEFKK